MTGAAGSISLWRDRDYRNYRVSRAVSLLGSHMSGLAFPLLVLGMGESAVKAGLLGTCAVVVGTLSKLPAGHLADRFDQKRLMLAMDAVRLAAVGSIPLAAALGHLTFPQLVAVALVEGVATAIFGSAAMVFVRVVVPPAQFALAMSQSQRIFGIAALVGPMLGGALYAVDPFLPFVVDTVSYAVSGVLLLGVSARPGERGRGEDEPAGEDRRVTAGLRWLAAHRGVLGLTAFCAVLNLVGAASGLAAVLVMSGQGVPSGVIGIVMACTGCGVVAGSLVVTRVMKLGPVRLYPAVGLLWAGSFGILSLSQSPWVMGACLTFMAALGPSASVMLFQLVAERSPRSMYGRVIAAQGLISTSLAFAGPLLAGVMVAWFGGTTVWLVFAGLCLAATLVAIPSLIEAGRAAEPAETSEPAETLEPAETAEPDVLAHDVRDPRTGPETRHERRP
ncbi:MFS transporter [Planobispora takensis]|uniref:MFS transporter n=1 Tax=Planobispora takensis TaxID=1367882 RepID=A0A8J3SRV0_9ACTN|nr:MFS transporter [Planobispora takensis]GIH99458.1 MFS transporter [Planobispora takensis]